MSGAASSQGGEGEPKSRNTVELGYCHSYKPGQITLPVCFKASSRGLKIDLQIIQVGLVREGLKKKGNFPIGEGGPENFPLFYLFLNMA